MRGNSLPDASIVFEDVVDVELASADVLAIDPEN